MTVLKDSFKALEVDHKESEIVEISENTECSIAIKIGDRSYKTLWDTEAGRCVISKDKYSSIPDKLKTQLHPSNTIIKAAEGSIISNDGECENFRALNKITRTKSTKQNHQNLYMAHAQSRRYLC